LLFAALDAIETPIAQQVVLELWRSWLSRSSISKTCC